MSLCKISIGTVAAVLSLSAAGWAASPANDPAAETPATTPSDNGGGSASVDQALDRYNFRRLYDAGPYTRPGEEFGRQAPLDWPAAEMREVAFARARTVIAKYEANRVRDILSDHIDALREDFEASADYVAASEGHDEAWAAYQSAVAAVDARLADDEEYQALQQLRDDLSGRIDDAKFAEADMIRPVSRDGWRRRSFVAPQVLELAASKLGYSRRATEMRASALSSDPAVVEAKARLQTASGRVRQLRAEFDRTVRRDETVYRLRDALAEARIAYIAAGAYEDSTRLIRRLAYRYANRLHRNDSLPYYGSVYYGSIGYGGVAYDPVVTPVGGYNFRRR